jgi:phosphoacetylglucosamine mutase
VEDNGVKIVDHNGEMLVAEWEGEATTITNAPNSELKAFIMNAVRRFQVPLDVQGTVVSGYDTRPSSVPLSDVLTKAVIALGSSHLSHGLVTTPVLHYCIAKHCNPSQYYEDTRRAFDAFSSEGMPSTVVLDAANGVGALAMKQVLPQLPIIHDGSKPGDVLNHECGSEFVQKHRACPSSEEGKVYASFDGDADRLVFSYVRDADKTCMLIDGDKIAALFAMYLRKYEPNVPITVVQTAYGNGSSTHFLKSLGCEIQLAKTGVKYLHHVAEHADIGIYFEANGHGTILFAPHIVPQLAPESRLLYEMMHPTVGDAIRDFLGAVAVLQRLGLTFEQWASFYSDMPSLMTKAKVADRQQFVCTDDETRLIQPDLVQKEIDAICGQHSDVRARCFVRPSGTEDCVRVYVEADDANVVRQVSELVHSALSKYA